MPSSFSKLGSLFRTSRLISSKPSPSSSPSASLVSAAEKAQPDSPSPSSSSATATFCPGALLRLSSTKKSSKPTARSKKSFLKRTGDLTVSNLNLGNSDKCDYLARNQITWELSSILTGTSPTPDVTAETLQAALDMPWISNTNSSSLQRKEVSRERKQKWVFKSTQDRRYQQLIKSCTQKLGAEAAMTVFGKLGRETGIKEYNGLIDVCIQRAKASDDQNIVLQEVDKAYQLLSSVKEQGLEVDEATYGPLLMYMIEMGMEEGFYLISKLVKGDTTTSILKFSYYEMLLYIRTNDDGEIRRLCDEAISSDEEEKHDVIGHYLVALCENDSSREEISLLLDVIDLMRISSRSLMVDIFKSLGRLQQESTAEKFLLAINDCGEIEKTSEFIFSYAANLPNLAQEQMLGDPADFNINRFLVKMGLIVRLMSRELAGKFSRVEDVILKFKNLHKKLKLEPLSTSYGKLITHCCNLHEVYTALDLADEMVDSGLTLAPVVLNAILNAIEEAHEFSLVHRISALIRRLNSSSNAETFRCLIHLVTRMKDFTAAYDMLKDMEKLNVKPTTRIYNTIMAGYFREKKFYGAKLVLQQMKAANVKPDSQTFSYLISNCDSEEDIIKYCEEMKQERVQPTKQVYISLINAYATCGQLEKAKEIINEKGIPGKSFNEIKSAIVSALASNGQISDALVMYDEIKNNKCSLEPKAAMNIIENLEGEVGQLDKILEVLKELDESDLDYWSQASCRVLIYCVRFNHISVAIDLLKQVQDIIKDHEMGIEVIIDEVFSVVPDGDSAVLQSGLDLFRAIKKEFGISPSRKVLDFLLSACVYVKNLQNSLIIWKKYQDADLPYNVLSYLRMYQALMACGDYITAKVFRKKIPKDDPHVRCILEQYDSIYAPASPSEGKPKRKKKNK